MNEFESDAVYAANSSPIPISRFHTEVSIESLLNSSSRIIHILDVGGSKGTFRVPKKHRAAAASKPKMIQDTVIQYEGRSRWGGLYGIGSVNRVEGNGVFLYGPGRWD